MRKITFNDEQTEYIIKSYSANHKTMRELAQIYNCSWSTIYRVLLEKNVEIKRKFKKKNLSNKKFGKLLVLGINEKRYKKDLEKSKKPHVYWRCICECGNYTEVESSHLLNGHTNSCGCIKSLGEQKISKILKENEIPYKKEVKFDDLKGYGNGFLRYDFAVLENKKIKYLIEFNGKQHYKKTKGWNTEEEFMIRKYNDNKKIEYCKQKNIPLIIIPYTKYKKLKIEDLMLDKTTFLIKEEI